MSNYMLEQPTDHNLLIYIKELDANNNGFDNILIKNLKYLYYDRNYNNIQGLLDPNKPRIRKYAKPKINNNNNDDDDDN